MKKLFIETLEFSVHVSAFLSDEDYTKLQKLLMSRPDSGKVMPGCGGMRKLRFSESWRGKGKRSGLRVIYLHVPEADWIVLAKVYGKGMKESLDADEKKCLRDLAAKCKAEASR